MSAWAWLRGRMSPGALAYVMAVTVLAAAGFASGQALLIGIAALVTLPASIAAVPAIYLAAGLLALVPGANPSHTSSSSYVSPQGAEVVRESGAPAVWYLTSIDVAGVVLLAVAAVANVLLLDLVLRWRRGVHAGA